MTLDDAIKHAEEVVEEQEKAAKEWHENQVRKCELFSFVEMDYTHENECKKCADEHRQLAEWLKDYKRLLEQQSSEDCVSRKELLKLYSNRAFELQKTHQTDKQLGINWCINTLNELPPVTPTQRWIPIITREPTEEEKKYYFEQNGGELCYMIDSPMPDNGQEVLVSGGDYVSEDVFDEDFWNFENRDIENVEAWMPKPKAYKKSEVMRNESNN